MLKSFLQKNKFLLLKISLLIVAIVLPAFIPSLKYSLNYTTESLIKNILPEKTPDTSIVLVNITSDDIEKIGPWPIKRSYYALLIRNLKLVGVKKIGLEVFLSTRLASQSVYDKILEKEIAEAGNVVLSSVAGEIYERNGKFFTDSLSYSTPKLLNEGFQTGHINFISDEDFLIPVSLTSFNSVETAFSVKLADSNTDKEKIILNFISSWNKFKKYSLLEFFELVNDNENAEKIFKDKIVLIGVTDPQISPQYKTAFDSELPGLALHAFAVDNLLNNCFYDDTLLLPQIGFSIILLLLMIYFFENQNPKSLVYASGCLFLFISVSVLLQEVFYFKVEYSYFTLGFAFIVIIQLIQKIYESGAVLDVALNEKEALRSLLQRKEEELALLKNRFENFSKENSTELKNEIEKLQSEIQKLQESNEDSKIADELALQKVEVFYGIAYRSKQMQSVVDLIKKAAPTDSTILITGESGTGKELVANAIHKLSSRADKNFVVVNCAALTETLLESELFGYVKGAFTGAISDKQGKFELADKGTIFLDEIGETSENFQVKLLRVLQSGDIEKVGSTKTLKVDVRVIAATNKNLEHLVREKKFRDDLFYRINVININLPPLRERKEDIDVIIKHLLRDESVQISVAALKALNEFDWPGNVRELESVIKRAVIFAKAEKRNIIQLNDLPDQIIKTVKTNFEELVLESLRQKKFSHSAISETAKELGNINRTVVAENFRGYSFKLFVENNFDKKLTVKQVASSEDNDVLKRVEQKFDTWIENIKEDINSLHEKDFESIKNQFASKYKNLPQRFHPFLDEVIKYLLNVKS
ncbi:MAG: sigma 54-interacting transcriptional regulator [Ignavibacterium album]|uniref:sigma 54-interacting transcriptional regulator n=1 Tax=Ignavibacterium album TaxID=591197 RepID=UPI0026EA50E1|nr:sigma 54-interacting transcriptional regulator [Ignavibacterium album]MBI5662518.1 sigma 54-interacting transcriptional regulator [Ignavibacterium album]